MQNLDKLNYFETFNLPILFQIDNDALESQYLVLQKQFHPDTAKDQIYAEINSILINNAYKTLKNPLKRAIYLLQLNNINIDDEQCSVKPSQETLMFIMELREEILENCQNLEETNKIKYKIKKMIADQMDKIADLLMTEKYPQASQEVIKIKYLDKIIFDLTKL